MKICNLQLHIEADSVVISADCFIRPFGPDRVYFKVEKKYADFVTLDMSPFAAALLIPSMKLGSDLVIEGEISEQLYKGMRKAMKVLASWGIGLKPISIFATHIKKDTYQSDKNAIFFSGGVDSFYTYLKTNEKSDQKISHFIMAHGFDIGLTNTDLWQAAVQTVEAVAEHEGVEVIKVESNIRVLTEPIISWGFTHGAALAALALVLRKKVKNVYVASTFSIEKMFIWGSHPDLDHLWGTETLTLQHDGTEATRLEKVKYISRHQFVLDNLRVCYWNKKGKFNCGTCDKCLRTMIELYLAGALERTKTFPTSIDIETIKRLEIEGVQSATYQLENLTELKRTHCNPQLESALQESIERFAAPKSHSIMDTARKIWFLDYYYNRSKLYKLRSSFLK